LPDAFRTPRTSTWSNANKAGTAIDSFLEGPCVQIDPSDGSVDRHGIPTHRIVSCAGRAITNLCFGGPDRSRVFVTDSDTGQILVAEPPFLG
jgi:hypothetical protein